MNRRSVVQGRGCQGSGVFGISHYKPLKKYLVCIGQYPGQTNLSHKCIASAMVCSFMSLAIPTVLQFYVSIRAKNWDGAIETLPHFISLCISMIKFLSLHFNRENFRKVFLNVEKDWGNLEYSRDMDILVGITGKGVKIAYVYRCVMLSSLVAFVTLPLVNPMLDIIIPLNETREREEIFKLYYFVNNKEHFYPIYVHSLWCSTVVIWTAVTVDSLNMIITHHASALFAICGSKIGKATECNGVPIMGRASTDDGLLQIRECVVAHNKAIQFFDFLDGTNRVAYLFQVGCTIIGISVTAFQTVMHLDNRKEAVRYALFLGGQNYHLFSLSFPGQVLSDYSTSVLDHIYNSKWYCMSPKMQRMMLVMQQRASKPCQLTAGGLYQMNIENFGAAVKTCMSYFTMLLSMKE